MRKLLIVGVFVLAIPTYAVAAPCVPDTLAAYISLGGTGCEIGGATVFDFYSAVSLGPGGPAKVDDGDVVITPTLLGSGLELLFSFDPGAGTSGPGENKGIQIVYGLGGLLFDSAHKSMVGAVTGSGAATAVEDLCLGGSFAAPPPGAPVDPTTCTGLAEILIADPTFSDSKTFGSFFDVFVSLDIQFDVPVDGSAEVESVTNRFAAVPEPGTFLLFGSGLIGALLRHRRRMSS